MSKKKKSEARDAIEKIRTAIHEAIKDLDDADYLEVLEVIECDCASGIEAKHEELQNPE